MFGKKENKLEKEEFLTVIENLTEALLVFDQKNRVSLVNPKAEALLGIEKEEVLGRNFLDLSFFARMEPIVSALGGGIERVSGKEIEIRENFILQVDVIKVGVDQKRVGTILIIKDISREKKVEKMKTEFVTLAAHQLRTPISGIKWSLRMLLDEEMGKLSKSQKEVLEKAYYTNNKVIDLINDLLNVAKIEEGKYISRTTLASLDELIEDVVKEHKEKIEEKRISCKIEKPKEELPKVMMDSDKMRVAFANILENSISYTPKKGKIEISLEKKVEYPNGNTIEHIKVSVKDSGVGIPEVDQDSIFEKFFRSKNVMRIETEGTGLGLYIAKNIIEAHEGRIWFYSEEGKGAAFFFTIPIKKKFSEYLTREFY